MRIITMAMCAVLSLTVGGANARDVMPGLQDAAIKLSFYDRYCAPLSPKMMQIVNLLIDNMPAPERTQQMAAVSSIVTNHHADFCFDMSESVRQIDR